MFYQILRSRYETAPEVVVYDNGCHLHDYALNRDPRFFRDTKFLIDRLHADNHVACSSGYDIRTYNESAELVRLNSQAAEQYNSMLTTSTPSLSHSTEYHFKLRLRLLFKYLNSRKKLSRGQ